MHVEGESYPDDEATPVECECDHCEKVFMLTLQITYELFPTKADCLNGAPHDMRPVNAIPKYWPDWARCRDCGHEEKGEVDQGALDKLLKRREELNDGKKIRLGK
jgi:hypothetical protein